MAVEIFGRPIGQVSKAASRASVFAPYRVASVNPPAMGAPFAASGSNQDTVQQMGPGEPAQNFPIGGEPRQYQYRVGKNFPTTPDTDRGISGALLRLLADASWLVRRCIEIRKAELCSLDWEIVARGKTGRERQKLATENEDLIQEVTDFFKAPDGGYFEKVKNKWVRIGMVDWGDWLNAGLEDHFVGDWWSLWPKRTVSGQDLVSLARVDGENIKALIDLGGRTPTPPLPAWQMYLYGAPRGFWAADEFYYMPRNVRNQTQYGFSHVQQSLVMINLALKYDQWNSATYNESTLPMGLLEAPLGISPDQLFHIADMLNGAVNTVAERLKIHPVPSGTKWQAIKPFEYSQEYAMYIIEGVCACFDVQPQELGYAPSRSGMGGSGFAEGQGEVHQRKSLLPTARWIERKLTKIINDQWRGKGGEFLEFRFTELIGEDLQSKYNANKVAIYSGQASLDDVLEEDGQDGLGLGHIMEIGGNILFLNHGAALTKDGLIPLDFNAVKEAAQQQQNASHDPNVEDTSAPDSPQTEAEVPQPTQDATKVASILPTRTGVMVALYPPPDVAKRLAIQDGENADELHVTLAYLGKVSDIKNPELLVQLVRDFASNHEPLSGTIAGIGRFNASNSSDGKDVVYGSVDAPGIFDFRHQLVHVLERSGYQVKKNHGFTPHITLAYVDSNMSNPIERIKTEPVDFDSVHLVIGGKHYQFSLGHKIGKAATLTPLLPSHSTLDPNQSTDDSSTELAEEEAQDEADRKSRNVEIWFAKNFVNRFGNRIVSLDHASTPGAVSEGWAYSPEEIQQLIEWITKLKEEAFIAGINETFVKAGFDPIQKLNDPFLKRRFADEAQQVATEIAETFKRDAQKAAQDFIDSGLRGRALVESMSDWEKARAKWKSNQISKTEASNPFVEGAVEAVYRNGWKVLGWEVTPEQCACDECKKLVDGNPYGPEQGTWLKSRFPVHVQCIHRVIVIFDHNHPPRNPTWKG